MSFFYCTTRVSNHYKVGISSTYSGIRKRLSDYRQIAPNTQIAFFTEVPDKEEIENSFKYKFADYRIGKSECYRLKIEIIFKHVLKFIHHSEKLFGFFDGDRYYICEYYFNDSKIYPFFDSYSFHQREHDKYRHPGFVCVADYEYAYNKKGQIVKTKKDNKRFKFQNISLDTRDKMKNYFKEYKHFINNIYYSKKPQSRSMQTDNSEKFNNEKFKEKGKGFWYSELTVEAILERKLFNQIKKHSSSLVKSYPFYKSKKPPFNKYFFGYKELHVSRYNLGKKIKGSFSEDHEHLAYYLGREISRKTYLNKDDFLDYFQKILSQVLNLRSYDMDKTKSEYLDKIRRILRESYKKIIEDISKIEFKKELSENVEKRETQKFLNKLESEKVLFDKQFINSVKILLSPYEKGFTMGLMNPSSKDLTEKDKEMCINIARGMIEYAQKNPHELFLAGEKILKKESKTEENSPEIKNSNSENVINFPEEKSKKYKK